jgi:TonB family protein
MSIRGCVLTLSVFVMAVSATAARADECPVRVSSVELEGRGIAGHVYRYRVVLSAASSNVPDTIGLRVDVAGGSPILVPELNAKLARDGEIYDGIVIFERQAQDISGAAVVSSGTGNVCTSPTVRIGDIPDGFTPTLSSVVMTLDDSNRATPDATLTEPVSVRSEAGSFRTEGALDYPLIAQEMNETGDVRVGIRIGPGDNIEKVWVVNSSGAKALDDAALAQASQSSYSAAIIDGIPVEEDYFIIDEFLLDFTPAGAIPDDLSACPAALDDVGLATGLLAGSAYWYYVDALAVSANIESLSIQVAGNKSASTVIRWSPVVGEGHRMLRGPNSKNQRFAVSGALFWPGAELSAGTVQGETIRSKKPQQCETRTVPIRNVLDPDTIVATAETDRPWLITPVLESVLPSRFVKLSWPKYVAPAGESKTPLSVVVSVHVTESGEPVVAYVSGASFAPEFAAAALSAAMASTYVVPRSPDGVPVTQTFETLYVYVPATASAGKPVGVVSVDRSDGNRQRTPHH